MRASDYATAVLSLQDTGLEERAVVDGLFRTLRARGHLKLLPLIVHTLDQQSAARARKNKTVLTLARPQDRELHAAAIAKHTDVAAADVEIDDTIVGGFILNKGTDVYDASYKTALITLYRNITSN